MITTSTDYNKILKMGKTKGTSQPDATAERLKELGNVAFAANNYRQAIECYTAAIYMAMKADPDTKPNHLLFANRANAQLQLKEYEACVEDCTAALYIEDAHVKSYLRGAYAHYFLHEFQLSLAWVKKGLEVDPEYEPLKKLQGLLEIDISREYAVLPAHHPERERLKKLTSWMKKIEARSSKLRFEFYTETTRGVIAAEAIKRGEEVLFVPAEALVS